MTGSPACAASTARTRTGTGSSSSSPSPPGVPATSRRRPARTRPAGRLFHPAAGPPGAGRYTRALALLPGAGEGGWCRALLRGDRGVWMLPADLTGEGPDMGVAEAVLGRLADGELVIIDGG